MSANMITPVKASSAMSARFFGSNFTRPAETAIRTAIAMTKRIAAKEIGGKSRSPTLIASHVELQIMQRAAKAIYKLRWSIAEFPNAVFRNGVVS